MEVRQPVIITCLGRSGTTIIHRMLYEYPQCCMAVRSLRTVSGKDQWNRWLMQAIDFPFVGTCLKQMPLTRVFQP
jgi:hypothetical protein